MHKKILVAIIILSVALRVGASIYLGDQIEILPGIFDQVSYDRLAQNILEGNGFSFDQDWWPVTKAGEPTAHWSYLMTLFLVVVYKIFGHHPLAARLIQSISVGILMPLFVYRITRKVYTFPNDTENRSLNFISLLSAAWTALYGYFIYYGAALMSESFFIVAILWSIDCSLRFIDRYKNPSDESESQEPLRNDLFLWLELGIAIGVASLIRQSYIIFIPFLLGWLWWFGMKESGKGQSIKNLLSNKKQLSRFFIGTFVSIFILFLFILPFTLYNIIRFDEFVLLNTNSGYVFFWSNHPIHEYKFVPLFPPDMPTYQELIPEELLHLDEAALDKALLKRGMGFVLENPWRYVVLSLSRVPEHFIFWPLPTSHIISNITRVSSLGVVLPFSSLGLIFWIKNLRENLIVNPSAGILLILFFLIYNGIHIATWAGIRYRLPTDWILIIFGSYAVFKIITLVRNGFFENGSKLYPVA